MLNIKPDDDMSVSPVFANLLCDNSSKIFSKHRNYFQTSSKSESLQCPVSGDTVICHSKELRGGESGDECDENTDMWLPTTAEARKCDLPQTVDHEIWEKLSL